MGAIDMFGGAIDELYTRAKQADERPDKDYGDLPPVRWFKFNTGAEKKKYQFGMFLMTYFSKSTEKVGLFRTRYQHYKLPTSSSDVITRTCMAKSLPGQNIRCPFCEVVSAEMEFAKTKDQSSALKQFATKGYAHVNALPTMILGRRPEYSQYEGDGKMVYLPHVVKMSEKLADKIAQYLRDNNALSDPNINPLNPMNAVQAIIEVERVGSRPMDVRYDISFGMQRSPWAASQEQIDYLYSQTYDLAALFRFATEEEYAQQWEEAKTVKAELERRRGNRPTTTTGFDAPSFNAPAPTLGQPTFAAPAPQAAPSFAPPQAAPTVAAPPPVQPSVAAPPAMPAPTFAPPTAPPAAPSFPTPQVVGAPASPSPTGSAASPTATSAPAAASTPSSFVTPPPVPSYGVPSGEPRVMPAPPSAPPPAPTFAAPSVGTVLGGGSGFQKG